MKKSNKHTKFTYTSGNLMSNKNIFFISIIGALLLSYYIGNKSTSQTPCANSLTCRLDQVEKIENGLLGQFQGKSIVPPPIALQVKNEGTQVLGESINLLEKHIYVDLQNQKLFAYEGTNKVFETYVSTGRWGRTPTGNFHIWTKLRSTRMSGGSGADYYNLPNVPYTMYFYGDFGIHGAYWHNNFGHTMSHGCVNLREIDAEVLFNWADGPKNGQKGTPVSICDTFIEPSTCVQNNPVR